MRGNAHGARGEGGGEGLFAAHSPGAEPPVFGGWGRGGDHQIVEQLDLARVEQSALAEDRGGVCVAPLRHDLAERTHVS